jgi:conjugative transfer region protein TrbK
MDARLLMRLAAVVFAAAAIAAAAFEMAGKERAAVSTTRSSEVIPPDPLRAAQRRYQLRGEAAARDTECLAVWAETRDRFLGTAPASTSPQLHHWR